MCARAAASARQLKRFALLRLVAVILGVKFDDLRQREQERDRRKRFTWASLAAALILLIGVGGIAYWDMTRPKTAFFREAILRRGVPEGLGPINEETRSHLETSYRVVTRRGRAVEVRRDSSGGVLRPDEDGDARWVVHYGANGLAEVIEIFDAYDGLVREDHLERGPSAKMMVVNFRRDTVDVAQAFKLFIDPTASSAQGIAVKTDITRHQLTFDDRGFAIKRRYQNHYGAPQHDLSGSYGENSTYSDQGLVLRNAAIGSDGNELTLKDGVRAVRRTYGPHHSMVSETLIGSNDEPFGGPNGLRSFVSTLTPGGTSSRRRIRASTAARCSARRASRRRSAPMTCEETKPRVRSSAWTASRRWARTALPAIGRRSMSAATSSRSHTSASTAAPPSASRALPPSPMRTMGTGTRCSPPSWA